MTQPTPNLNALNDEAIIGLLATGEHARLLAVFFGEALYGELHTLAQRAASVPHDRGTVMLLPGIMGSQLGIKQPTNPHLFWLDPNAVHEGKLLSLAMPHGHALEAVGVMLMGYIKARLTFEAAGFEVIFYPYDWRQHSEHLGRELMATIERIPRPAVLLVGHSMGGLVARAALRHDTGRRIQRLIQVGTPNFGSFAPLQALRAVYPAVRKVAALDPDRSPEELARQVFHTFPSLYDLLPLPERCDGHDLLASSAWPRDTLTPETELFETAQRARVPRTAADERCSAIVGVDQETVTAVEVTSRGFEYLLTPNGDGTVPTALADWPGARTWYARERHGLLMFNDVVLAAVARLLADTEPEGLASQAPSPTSTGRRVSDDDLRRQITQKVRWSSLSMEARRSILDPLIPPEFAQ